MLLVGCAFSGITRFPLHGYEIDASDVVTKLIKIGTEICASKRGTGKLYYHNDHPASVNVVTDATAIPV